MKTISFIIVLLAFMTGVQAAPKSTATQSLDRIIVVLDDTVITASELDDAIRTARNQLAGSQTAVPGEDVLRKQVLDQLINRKLQLKIAEMSGLKATDEDINKAIARIASENRLTVNELYQKLPLQGLSLKNYRREIHDQMLIQQIQQQEVAAHITITPQEVDDFLRSKTWMNFNTKEYHLQDILITLPDAPTTESIMEAKSRADNIVNKLHQGMSFQDAAASESGSGTALQGGDLGWRKLPEIPAEFSSALVHAKPDEVIGPLLTPNGFHIIKLAGVRSIVTQGNKEEQHKQVQQLIFQRKFEEALQTWLTKIRSATFINMHPEG